MAQNPENLGIGIDEADGHRRRKRQRVLRAGFGRRLRYRRSEVTYSNIAEEELNKTLSIYDVRMHMLSQGDRFDLLTRRPRLMKGRAAEKLPEKEQEPQPA